MLILLLGCLPPFPNDTAYVPGDSTFDSGDAASDSDTDSGTTDTPNPITAQKSPSSLTERIELAVCIPEADWD